MARSRRSANLGTRTSRLELPVGERHVEPISQGCYLIYQRPRSGASGAWLARWFDLETKKQKQTRLGNADDYLEDDGISVLTFTQAQAKARPWFTACSRHAAMEADGEIIHQGSYTVADALGDFIADGRRRGMKQVDAYEQVAKTRILPALGGVPVVKLTRKRIEDWHFGLAESGRLKTGRKREDGEELEFLDAPQSEDGKRARKSSANRYLTILKRALNLAYERRKVDGGAPWREVKPLKGVEKSRTRFLSQEEQVRLVNSCPPDFKRLVQGALLTGARYGELRRIRSQDFNAEAGTVWIEPGKTGKGRHVVLTDEGKGFFASLCTGKGGSVLLFTRDQVQRSTREDAGLDWASSDQVPYMARACKSAKVEALGFHELRHTYASHLVNRGVPLAYVAAQLGHSSTRMVEKHYGHLAPSALAESIRKNVPTLGITEASTVQAMKIKGA